MELYLRKAKQMIGKFESIDIVQILTSWLE